MVEDVPRLRETLESCLEPSPARPLPRPERAGLREGPRGSGGGAARGGLLLSRLEAYLELIDR